MDAAARFGELRSLLQQPPDAARFAAICQLIDDAEPAHAAQQLVPYALDLLRRWPDSLRAVTPAALDALDASRAAPSLRLIRALDTGGRWVDDSDAALLLAGVASLRHLRLQGALSDEAAAKLAAHPAMDALTHLDLARNQLGDAGVAALAHAPYAPRLTHLDLSWNNARDAGMRALADAPLEALETLWLEGSWATPEAASQLKRAACCGRLSAFGLGGRHVAGAVVGWLGWPALQALHRAGFFAQTRHVALPTNVLGDAPLEALTLDGPLATDTLDLRDNRIDGPALARLADAVLPPSLTRLDLSSNPLRGEGVAALVRRPLHRLETLHLTAAQLDAGDLAALSASQNLPALTALHLDHNHAEPSFAAALVARPLPYALETLSIGYNRLTDEGVAALAQSPAMARVHTLLLQECELTAAACRHLAASPYLRGLRALWLNHNIIGDEGAAWLARGEWAALEALHLWRCGVRDEGARALAAAPWTARLTLLDLTDNPIYQGGRDALSSAPHLPDALRRRFVGPPPRRRRLLPGEDPP